MNRASFRMRQHLPLWLTTCLVVSCFQTSVHANAETSDPGSLLPSGLAAPGQLQPGHGNSATRWHRRALCGAEIRAAANLFAEGNINDSRKRLQNLLPACGHLPQLTHNLGVIAASEADWQSAIEYFEMALDKEAATAESWRSLQGIARFTASSAYAKALGLRNSTKPPTLAMQIPQYGPGSMALAGLLATSAGTDATSANPVATLWAALPERIVSPQLSFTASAAPTVVATAPAASTSATSREAARDSNRLTTVAATPEQLLFDLSGWWNAQIEQDPDRYAAAYRDASQMLAASAAGGPFGIAAAHANAAGATTKHLQLPAWEQIDVTLEVADSAAVAVLEYELADGQQRRLLMLEPGPDSWGITRERDL